MKTFPHLHLLVSGGNSQIIWVESWQNWQIIGQTQDDAAGECLDKIGRMIGLDYPGGVWLSRIAKLQDQNPLNFPISSLSKKLPEEKTNKIQNLASAEGDIILDNSIKNSEIKPPKIKKQNSFLENPNQIAETEDLETSQNSIFKLAKNYNYSFSGLKTAVRYFLQKQKFVNWTLEQKITKIEMEILLNWHIIKTFLKNFETLEKKENLKIKLLSLDKTEKFKEDYPLDIEDLEIKDLIAKMVEKKLIFETSLVNFWEIIQSQDIVKLELFWQVCVSAQFAVITQLTRNFEMAINDLNPRGLGISGGVSANPLLRLRMTKLTEKYKMEKLYLPPLGLTGDNAVMIALAGIADLWSENNSFKRVAEIYFGERNI